MAEYVFTLRNVRKTYPGGVDAIKGITFDVPDGQFCVLVGPSGCGKSTLLRMVAGLETVTSGEIDIGGRVVNQVEPADRDIVEGRGRRLGLDVEHLPADHAAEAGGAGEA